MSANRTIQTAIQKMAGKFKDDHVKLMWGHVVSVDEAAATCVVRIKNDVQVPNVALQAAVCDGLLLVPSVDSTVVIAKSVYGPYALVVQTSDLDKVYLQVGAASITLWSNNYNGPKKPDNGQSEDKDEEIQFNDGSFGGLLKLRDPDDTNAGVLARLNKLEDDNNKLRKALKDTLTLSVINEPGNVSPSALQIALKSALATWYSSNLTPTTRGDIENPLITHGK